MSDRFFERPLVPVVSRGNAKTNVDAAHNIDATAIVFLPRKGAEA